MMVPLIFGSGAVPAAAQETADSSTETVSEVSTEDDVQYINGIEADYEDPDCVKYLENLELSAEDESDDAVMQLYSSSYNSTSSWGGTTYYHRDDLAAFADIYASVDVSKWQADINWTKVKAAGINFAFIRLGYRSSASSGTLNMDSYYKKNMTNAIAAGVKVGVYFFSQAITVAEAQAEANYVLSNLGSYDLDLPIVIDYEYADGRLTSSLSNATKTSIVNAFCKVIENAGYEAAVYSNQSMLTDDINADDIGEDYEIWLAQWNTKASYTGTYTYWQSTSSASVNGISGNVDLDWWYEAWEYESNGTVVYDSATGKWVYQNTDGEIDYSYTGFAENSNGWWYLENGVVTFNKNSVIYGSVKGKSAWWYVVGSKVQTSFTGLANYANKNGWWYIRNGRVNFTVNTVAKNKNGWYYVTGGKVQFGFTGLANHANSNGWWYIKNGKVDFTKNTVAKNKNGWYYVTGGKVQFGYTGLANYPNKYGWWYIQNGKVKFTYNGIAKNKNGWWYVRGGQVIFSYTGYVTVSSGTYYVRNGKVNR